MAAHLDRMMKIEVPIIVLLGEKSAPLRDVVSMMPGAIIELPKAADSELELRVNNKVIGTAVKVGENFGLRISYIGDVRSRITALGGSSATPAESSQSEPGSIDAGDAALAEALLAEQR